METGKEYLMVSGRVRIVHLEGAIEVALIRAVRGVAAVMRYARLAGGGEKNMGPPTKG